MSDRTVTQYYGPSRAHPRACVEMRFAMAGETCRLAPLEPLLMRAGIRLNAFLPDEPLPLDEAVCRLASVIMARHSEPWSDFGHDDGIGWVAIGFPFPRIAALVLETSLELALAGSTIPAALVAKIPPIAEWLVKVNYIEMWMMFAADVFGRDAPLLNTTIGIYQVGQGAKGVQFLELGSSRDSFTGMTLENSKRMTIETLRRVGLPTTRGVMVNSTDQTEQAIATVGLPCVVKPVSMSKGAGVATGLASPQHVRAALAHAIKLSQKAVLVENHVEGLDHRLTVIGDELLWVYRKVPASVTGDGKASVRALIERENQRRAGIRSGTEAYLYQIAIDQELARFLMGRYGIGLDAVLPKGQRIELAGQANIARGGYLEDVTEQVHPDNRELAIRAARLFRMYSLGIDYVTPDISRSWKDVETAIIEVNRTPGISGMGDATLVHRTMFPQRRSGRIPLIAAIGDEAFREEVAEQARATFTGHGLRAMTAEYLSANAGRQPIKTLAIEYAVETLLLDPEADAGAVLCEPERVEAAGFPLRHCDLLLVQDGARFGWLEGAADTLVAGPVAKARLADRIGKLAKLYADPAEGGALPVLEPVEPQAKDEFRIRVWRARAMPREWFWAEVGAPAPNAFGMTTHADLLAALAALAGTKGAFAHEEILGPWVRVTFDAWLTLSARNRDKARAALEAAVERVNAICAAPIS